MLLVQGLHLDSGYSQNYGKKIQRRMCRVYYPLHNTHLSQYRMSSQLLHSSLASWFINDDEVGKYTRLGSTSVLIRGRQTINPVTKIGV